jgi:hypothetical protein
MSDQLKDQPKQLKENRSSNNNLLKMNEIELVEVKHPENDSDNDSPRSPDNIVVNLYRLSLKWYFVYIMYGLIGGIIINIISSTTILQYDMLFNILFSPIIYYNSPRKILTRITTKEFLLYYTLPFICGLFFRFLDTIPVLNQFSLNFNDNRSPIQYILLAVLLLLILCMLVYYIYISSEPLINSLLCMIYILITSLTCYYYYNNNGKIHIHHYLVGIIMMLLSKNSKYKVIIILHGIGYAIYIEGISKWGFAPIFWQ